MKKKALAKSQGERPEIAAAVQARTLFLDKTLLGEPKALGGNHSEAASAR